MHVLQNAVTIQNHSVQCMCYKTEHNKVTHQNHSVLCMCYKTEHNTVTYQNHSVHCACVTKRSHTSEPLCNVHVFQNTVTHQIHTAANCTLCMCYSTTQERIRTTLYNVNVLQHNIVTYQNHSACVTAQHSNVSEPLCTVCMCYSTTQKYIRTAP